MPSLQLVLHTLIARTIETRKPLLTFHTAAACMHEERGSFTAESWFILPSAVDRQIEGTRGVVTLRNKSGTRWGDGLHSRYDVLVICL